MALSGISCAVLPVAAAAVAAMLAAGDAPRETSARTIGLKDGLKVSLWPTPGPRGLISVMAPKVFPGSERPRVNFIAIEPVVNGRRGYSELEKGSDGKPGKRMWFSDCLMSGRSGKQDLANGIPGRVKSGASTAETLSIVVNVEPFENGAHPQVQVLFRADRPDEVGFRVYAAPDSAPMDSCVLTATMGNYARARLLYLKDEIVDSRTVWPSFNGDGFTEPEDYPLTRLHKAPDGTVTAFITPSEKSLKDVAMPRGGWPFDGEVPTQYWRKYPGKAADALRVRVNGRRQYWKSQVDIPGGIAFENFEFIEPFRQGAESWFGVSLRTPRELGWQD